MAQNPDHYAVVVGVNDYPAFRPLRGAIADATRFAHWLVNDVTGGGVPAQNMRTVFSQPAPLRPIHDDVDDALDSILGSIAASARRFYFYFSGHGFAELQSNSLLCLPRWSEKWRNHALDMQHYVCEHHSQER
jgi:hypothetical protein